MKRKATCYNAGKKIWVLMALIPIMMSSTLKTVAQVPLWKTLPEVPAMPKADESGLAPVNDIKMYYAIFNKAGGNPVILLHGGFANSDFWGFEVPMLLKTHEVIVVDNRGHGRSTMSDQPFSYNLMTSDVLKLMDDLKVKKASIVGWSDGGIIGLLMAIHYPDRIDKLFTYGANFDHSGDSKEPMDPVMSSKFMAKAKADYQRLSPTPDDFTNFRSAIGKMYGLEPNLKPADISTIKAPTIIARGQYEQFIKPEHFEALTNLIPGAKLVVIPNVSHGGPLQDPYSFHQAVINLLDSK
jgi:pimeloyl-ACP methyl ester carboxylesterase